jgi:tRNA(Arg) A34 adenosine deaminase TadA
MTSADRFLEAAIQEARQELTEGGIPIGSVTVPPRNDSRARAQSAGVEA